MTIADDNDDDDDEGDDYDDNHHEDDKDDDSDETIIVASSALPKLRITVMITIIVAFKFSTLPKVPNATFKMYIKNRRKR